MKARLFKTTPADILASITGWQKGHPLTDALLRSTDAGTEQDIMQAADLVHTALRHEQGASSGYLPASSAVEQLKLMLTASDPREYDAGLEAIRYVPPKSKFLGAGNESMAFDLGNDKVAKITYGPSQRTVYAPPVEAPDPPILQPLFYRTLTDDVRASIYPRADLRESYRAGPDTARRWRLRRGVDAETVLEVMLEEYGIFDPDMHAGNIGFIKGKPVLIDTGHTEWPRGWKSRKHVNFPLLMALLGGGAYATSEN